MAETWLLNETITSALAEQTVNFVSSGSEFVGIKSIAVTSGFELKYYVQQGSSTTDLPAYDTTNGWLDTTYRAITFAIPPTGDLLTWLQANGNKLVTIEPGTYIFKDIPDTVSVQFNEGIDINFKVKDSTYSWNKILVDANSRYGVRYFTSENPGWNVGYVDIHQIAQSNYVWGNYDESVEDMDGDADENVKTITIETAQNVHENFATWFNANTTKQTVARKSYDLSTSAKWATLTAGNHNVQIVAKASGYRDSEKSAAVSVTKQSIVAYKATITGLGNSSPTSQTYTVDSGFPTSFEEVTKDGDIFIKIPTMYRKVNTVSSNQITSFTISNVKEDDSYYPYPCFVRPDGSVMDYILIGKYMISSSSTANSVNATNVTLTPAQGIALCKNKGAGYYPYDVWTQKLFQDLELAIGKKVDYQNGSVAITVSKIGLNHLDKDHWVLGVIGSSGSWYACYDPDKYQALEATNSPIPQDYVQIGYVQPTTSDEIQKLGYDESNQFFNYPTAVVYNTSYNTYYCDGYNYSSGNHPVYSNVGLSNARLGLWLCDLRWMWLGSYGVRLCFRPL